MPNDHYISRFLTRPWEYGQRNLRFVDLDDGRVHRRSSETLFAQHGLHSAATGAWLNSNFEQTVSQFHNRLRVDPKIQPTSAEAKALTKLLLFQARRFPCGAAEGAIDAVARGALGDVDVLADAWWTQNRLLGVFAPRENLFVTERSYFVLPIVGGPPVQCLPVMPTYFVAAVRRDQNCHEVDKLLATEGTATAFSVGVSDYARVVVVPPSLHHNSPAELVTYVRDCRERARRIFELIYTASSIAGLQAWTLNDRDARSADSSAT